MIWHPLTGHGHGSQFPSDSGPGGHRDMWPSSSMRHQTPEMATVLAPLNGIALHWLGL